MGQHRRSYTSHPRSGVQSNRVSTSAWLYMSSVLQQRCENGDVLVLISASRRHALRTSISMQACAALMFMDWTSQLSGAYGGQLSLVATRKRCSSSEQPIHASSINMGQNNF